MDRPTGTVDAGLRRKLIDIIVPGIHLEEANYSDMNDQSSQTMVQMRMNLAIDTGAFSALRTIWKVITNNESKIRPLHHQIQG